MAKSLDYITQFQTLKIGSSIYLLIRGFDNLKKGLEEADKKKTKTRPQSVIPRQRIKQPETIRRKAAAVSNAD